MTIGHTCPNCGQKLSDQEYAEALRKAMTPGYHDGGSICRVCGKSWPEKIGREL